MITATIITVGDEILIGQVTDTNSGFIASALDGAGFRTVSMLTVGDDARQIERAVKESLSASRIIIMTGGLGPTKDDITKKTLAALFGCELVFDQSTYDYVNRMLSERGVPMNPLNESQAMVPSACRVIRNEHGTAPGMWFNTDCGSVLISLPGVPFEMERLVTDRIIPLLRDHFPSGRATHITMNTTGIPESVLAEMIEPWENALPEEFHLAYLPSTSGVRLRLSVYDSGPETESRIKTEFRKLEPILGAGFLGYGTSATPAGTVAEKLTASGATLSIAESCTGGYLSSLITAMPGSSEYFLGSVVSYSNDVKINVLGVDADSIASEGAVSSAVAAQMAEGVRRLTGSDYAVATTGVAGPGGGTPDKPVGTVWIGIAGPRGTVTFERRLGKLRKQNIERASTAALNALSEYISGRSL